MDIKTKSYIIMGGWLLYLLGLYVYRDRLINIISNSGFFTGTIIYFLTNPAYLLLIYLIIKTSKRSKIKATISSIIMVWAFDMSAFPRIVLSEIFSTSSSAVTNMGTIAIKSMVNFGIPQMIAYFSYYVLIPLILMWFALELGGYVNFVKKFAGGGF